MAANQEIPQGDPPSRQGEAIPPRLGPYRIEARLGSGGMGEVFRGFDERLTRAVAIKWVHPAALNPNEEPEVARRRFRREARAVARLNHPTIVQIYHVLELHDEGDAIVMELVLGQSLARILLEERSLSPQRAVEIGLQVAAGLAEAHEQEGDPSRPEARQHHAHANRPGKDSRLRLGHRPGRGRGFRPPDPAGGSRGLLRHDVPGASPW